MKRLLVIGGVMAALAVGAVAVAGAQEATPTPTEKAAGEVDPEAGVDHYLELLAGNLGISVEDLKAGLTQTNIDLINEKVADGTLTQEEADEIIAKLESGEGRLFPFFIGGHGGPGHPLLRIVGNVLESAASVLDMEVADLREQLDEDTSLGDIAEAQGMSIDDFKAALQADLQAKIDEKVADGTITEEMGQRLSDGLAEHIDRIVEATPGDGPFGGHRPFRDGPRFFNGPDDDQGAEESDTETSLIF